MKIYDLIETQQDEGVGSAIGKVAGGIGKAVGGVVGGAKAIGSAVKSGYQAGSQGAQQSILGQTPPTANPAGGAQTNPAGATTDATGTAPTAAPGATPTAGTNAPASGGAPAKGTADFGTIQRSIKTLSPKQKTALATQLSGGKPATTAPATPATPPATTAAPAATAPTGPQKGQEVSLEGGEKYRFLGQQWVEVDPATGAEKGGAALPAGFQKSLTGIAAKQPAAPTGTPDLKVVNGGKAAVAEGVYYRSKFLNIIL